MIINNAQRLNTLQKRLVQAKIEYENVCNELKNPNPNCKDPNYVYALISKQYNLEIEINELEEKLQIPPQPGDNN